ncbi:hypothetical protein MMA231_03989 (plasmid) [Asticcacaulis sp. MM231]|uniref:phytanoyl-CoA dioxygenase family protein n=1 Tax=Asticcacaulis sp. MM231 TaxID=3157666 RepID=UPI0032D5AE80
MLTSAQHAKFRKDGYLFLPGLLPAALINDLRRESESLLGAGPKRQAWNERACFRRKPFRDLLTDETLISIVRDLVGDDLQLLALDLRIVGPGVGRVDWHRDTSFVCDRTLAVNCAIYLQDTSERLGPLQIVPESHRSEAEPSAPDETLAGGVTLPGPAGSVVIHDAATWHTASPNRTGDRCWMAFPFFGKFWIKRMDHYFTQPLPAALTQSHDPVIRQLVGVELQPGVRSFLGDSAEYNLRGEVGIDFEAA